MPALAIYLTGLLLIGVVSWAVAIPFFRPVRGLRSSGNDDDGSRWQKRKDEALAAIRDAEFDFHLGKLSESDYKEMRRRLEGEALEAMRALSGHGDA